MSPRNPRVLVGGPMQRLFSEAGFDSAERERVTAVHRALAAADCVVLSAHVAESFARVHGPSQEVARRDHRWTQECDVYLALLPTGPDGWPVTSWGTGVELGWVSARRVPVVIVRDAATHHRLSHLVRGLDAITTVRYVDAAATPSELAELVRELVAGIGRDVA